MRHTINQDVKAESSPVRDRAEEENSAPLLSRREALLTGAACLPPLLSGIGASASETFALPGAFRGRVVEVSHAQIVKEAKIVPDALREMMTKGMMRLTGEHSEIGAWRHFFGKDDIVGIKGCPVGIPDAIAHPETLTEVIRGLMLAGVHPKNIIVFERNETDLKRGGYTSILPEGARNASGSPASLEIQLRTEGYPGTTVSGYDEKVFVDFPRLGPGADANNPAHRRSCLLKVASQDVTKVVNVCSLKDHAASGVTMALKNMSHGFTNNTWRTHVDPASPWTDLYIPAVVGLPTVRKKVALHICDALWGVYDGGPGNWNPHFRSWQYGAILFATDPVALDRIGWNILDQKRRAMGLPCLAETGTQAENPGHETFARRQPHHILRAGEKGLGESRLDHITHLRVKLGT